MASGIYLIRNKMNDKAYVGSAKDFANRFGRHRHLLRRGKHHSPKLQHSWNKHGEAAFEFVRAEEIVDLSTLVEREQAWIDRLDAARSGFNIVPMAGSMLGYKMPRAVREKIGRAHKGRKKTAAQIETHRQSLIDGGAAKEFGNRIRCGWAALSEDERRDRVSRSIATRHDRHKPRTYCAKCAFPLSGHNLLPHKRPRCRHCRDAWRANPEQRAKALARNKKWRDNHFARKIATPAPVVDAQM